MKTNPSWWQNPRFLAPEHGGQAVKSGRRFTDDEGGVAEQILDATGEPVRGLELEMDEMGVSATWPNPYADAREAEEESAGPAVVRPPRQGLSWATLFGALFVGLLLVRLLRPARAGKRR